MACEQKSPREINGQQPMHEHDKVRSRTTGKQVEICMGPHCSGLVPANPFASIAQARFLHAHPEKVGGEGALKEWDSATNFKSIPKKAKKK